MKAKLSAALAPLVGVRWCRISHEAVADSSQITPTNKYAGDPNSPTFEPPSPLIERPIIPLETETLLQKACAHIVTEVKLNEEDLGKSDSKRQAQKKNQKHDKHSSFTFQKARGYVPEVAATSFAKTTSRPRRSDKPEHRLDKNLEPLEPTTTRVGHVKPAAFASPDDEALWEIRNKLDARPKTSAAACVDYAGEETSGSSMQSTHTTAITSANLTPGHSSKRISQRPDSHDLRPTQHSSARFSGVNVMVKDNEDSVEYRKDRANHQATETDSGNLSSSDDLLVHQAPARKSSRPSTEHTQAQSLSMNKSAPSLPLGDLAVSLTDNNGESGAGLRKMPSLPQITQKVNTREGSFSQPTYTSYYGRSIVPSNSAAPSRPGTSHEGDEEEYRRGRSMSITNSIREYIRPSSSQGSRAPSKSRAPSLRSQSSLTGVRGQKEPAGSGWHGLRKKISNISMRTRSRSSSHSRPGYDDGDEYFIDADKVDLNKNLPPLPGLDTYEAKPKHIGELMRKALPKNKFGRDTANVVIDKNGVERVMTAQEQVQRRQDLARAVMEKMTTGSMGSGDSRPTSPKEAGRETAKNDPGSGSNDCEVRTSEPSIEHRTKQHSDAPQQPSVAMYAVGLNEERNSFMSGAGGSRPQDRAAQRHESTIFVPKSQKTKRSGNPRKWAYLFSFGRNSKNSSKVVHVM